MTLPLLIWHFGCNPYCFYAKEWRLNLILAPFPPEEQEQGHWIKALANIEVRLSAQWPFITCDVYAPRRQA